MQSIGSQASQPDIYNMMIGQQTSCCYCGKRAELQCADRQRAASSILTPPTQRTQLLHFSTYLPCSHAGRDALMDSNTAASSCCAAHATPGLIPPCAPPAVPPPPPPTAAVAASIAAAAGGGVGYSGRLVRTLSVFSCQCGRCVRSGHALGVG